jgi:4-hydroxythreonine-4-phosphate dehydrogenase
VQPLALTLGEPAGIGPDLALAIWQRRAELDIPPFYIVAEPEFLGRRAAQLGLRIPIERATPATAAAIFRSALPAAALGLSISAEAGKPDQSSAPAAVAAIRRAVADVLAGSAAAIVTNPVAKNVLYNSGFAEPGHTEFLARLVQEASGKILRPVMMLWSPELAVVPVTIHLPLKEIFQRLSTELIVETGRIVARDLAKRFALPRPRLVSLDLFRTLVKPACSARKTERSSRRPSRRLLPKASMREDRFPPIRCFTKPHARATMPLCACITIRR